MHLSKLKKLAVLSSALVLSANVSAVEFEVTPMLGQMFANDMKSSVDGSDLSVDSGSSFGVALSWQDTPNGQGQVLIQSTRHDFKSEVDNNTYDLDILYAHFNGVAQFRNPNYVSTVSLGLGGALFDSLSSEKFYPSATISFGTRHEMSPEFTVVTELRGYATLVDESDGMFCQGEVCHGFFGDSLWLQSSFSVGVAYKF